MPEFHFDPQNYGPAVAGLLTPELLMELGPGSPNEAARELLEALTPESLLAPHHVGNRDMARACL
ncbi:MAG TPA: hypothetical protein VGX78_19275, partial [Pirellulales bacterium]|nr:hypothetical protein [Pirellulales bacterium]